MAGARTIVAALAVLLVLAAPAAARRHVPVGFFGANWDGEVSLVAPESLQQQQFTRMARAGVESTRASFVWAQAQPQDHGPFQFDASDSVVAMAAAHHIGVLPVVILAPSWARQSKDVTFSPPRDPADYAAYLTALVGRYGPSGSFWTDHPELPRLPIRAWQIWNEPHLPFQWTVAQGGQPWPQGYVQLLKAAYSAVKSADPGAQVVLAALTNASPAHLEELYKAGAHGYFDVAAIHPYTRVSRGVVTLARRFRAVMHRNHDGSKPLWATELGLPASRGRVRSHNVLQTTPRGMARFLEHVYAGLVHARHDHSVAVSRGYWYTWAAPYATTDIFRYTGLFLYPGGDSMTTQPAYRAYVHTARRYEGCAKTSAGACR